MRKIQGIESLLCSIKVACSPHDLFLLHDSTPQRLYPIGYNPINAEDHRVVLKGQLGKAVLSPPSWIGDQSMRALIRDCWQ